ncbi:IS5/IS1182 family transposase [Streptomyces rubiginosohelvolus]|uniref:IS5/IS1182 family transposase n=1 Tax=Streptomyces rubiginosohelvolus TaxID=67362 RepID=UPI0036D19E96
MGPGLRVLRRWRDHGLVKEFHDRLRRKVREQAGRDPEPSAGVIDSQSVKADAVVGADSRGFDGGKLLNGRKRHAVVDTLGLLLGGWSPPRASATAPPRRFCSPRLPPRATGWRWSGPTVATPGSLVERCRAVLALVLAIVRRSDDMRGFVVLPKRWIVERFFAHLMRSRRLARDLERSTGSAEAMVHWSMTLLMTRRLARRRPSRA